ncbi:MAG: ABC transporter substrate-binding protein [Anaerotruncus sp.]|nr:ABC transporter substrate-binding protein [Anaerotruncus sp.]
MKKLSRPLALLLMLAMAFSLVACGGGSSQPASSSAASTESSAPAASGEASSEPADGASYVVGISQLVTHPALDAATEGFQDALNKWLPGQVTFDYQNAANDPATCATIANAFVSKKVDLIMANATPALQAAATATADIPVLGTSVTEYGVAFGIKDFSGTVGGNISGTSDLAPLDQQAAMIKEWYPNAKKVGLLYCSNEANSQYQVDTVQSHLEGMGYTCTQYPFSDSNDIAAVTQSAADNNDILYVPTDNTAASNTPIIDNICHGKIPVFAGEEGLAAGCGVATLSISYYDIGYKTGEMAAKILLGEADISTMPIEYAPEFVKKYNPPMCEDLGITPPEGYVAIEAAA